MNCSGRVVITLTFAFAIGGIACGANQELSRCDEAVNEFHGLFSAQQYQVSYKMFDDPYKRKVSVADHESFFAMLWQRLGAVKDAKRTGWQIFSQPGGTRISVQYETVFANGDGHEQFLFFLTDSKVILENYDLQSPLLVDK